VREREREREREGERSKQYYTHQRNCMKNYYIQKNDGQDEHIGSQHSGSSGRYISLSWMAAWSIQNSQRYILRPCLSCKNQSNKQERERTQRFLLECLQRIITFTPVLYSSFRILKCPNLNYSL
jgi:hypothetical protein